MARCSRSDHYLDMFASKATGCTTTSDVTRRSNGVVDARSGRGLGPGLIASGRYQLGGLIGSGGMGLVYEAMHVSLGTTVAIKVLRPELMERSELVALFVEEARCLAALSSANVVRIQDAGRLHTGLPYFVMERLSGIDLAAVIETCAYLPAPVAVDYALQVCAGLAAAHEIGLVHLDVKPTNLFLATGATGPGVIKVLDFGIARWLPDGGGHMALPAQDGPLCSCSYSSPEQIESEKPLDQRSDVWSLGAVMFEMLTGECPFARADSAETRSGLLSPMPSVRHLQPDVDPRLAGIVETCLEPNRSSRYASMDELAEALSPFASAESTAPSTRSRLGSGLMESRAARAGAGRSAGSTSRQPSQPAMCA